MIAIDNIELERINTFIYKYSSIIKKNNFSMKMKKKCYYYNNIESCYFT